MDQSKPEQDWPGEDDLEAVSAGNPKAWRNTGNGVGHYREAAEMRVAENDSINAAAVSMCEAFGISTTDPSNATYLEHAQYLALAMQVYIDRNPETLDAWRGPGWAGNLLSLHGKALRLMNSLWWTKPDTIARSEKPIDNAMDTVNYAVFFARCYDAGDERGGPQTFKRS